MYITFADKSLYFLQDKSLSVLQGIFFLKKSLEMKWNLSSYIFYFIRSFFYQLSLLSATLSFSDVLLVSDGSCASYRKQGYLWYIFKDNNFKFQISNWNKRDKIVKQTFGQIRKCFSCRKKWLAESWNIKDVGISFTKILHWISFFEGNGILLTHYFVGKYHQIQQWKKTRQYFFSLRNTHF